MEVIACDFEILSNILRKDQNIQFSNKNIHTILLFYHENDVFGTMITTGWFIQIYPSIVVYEWVNLNRPLCYYKKFLKFSQLKKLIL